MPDQISLLVDGQAFDVPADCTVAVAIGIAERPCRNSVTGQARGPLCGMGICFECRVSIDGRAHLRGCQILVRPGMDVRTGA